MFLKLHLKDRLDIELTAC